MGKKSKNDRSTLKEGRLFVDGMHCASCEVLIEKKFLKKEGVKSVDASTANSEVRFFYESETPNITDLNSEFEDLGYSFSNKKTKKNSTPFISLSNGQLSINPEKSGDFFIKTFLVISLIIAFFIIERSGLAARLTVTESSNVAGYFLFGLFAGASSCAALVGGLLLSMSKQWNEAFIDEENKLIKSIPHVLFHIGRLISFAIVGGLLALTGDFIKDFVNSAAIFVSIIIAFVMFVMGMQMIEVSWAKSFRFALPKSVGRFAADESNFKGRFMPFLTGFLSFLIPCGLTLVAFGLAITSGNFLSGAMNMFAFALGTFVFLGMISLTAIGFTSKPIHTANFNKIAGILVIFFAFYTLNAQVSAINSKYQLNLPTAGTITSIFAKREKVEAISDGSVQKINMTVRGIDFVPAVMQVKAGVPVEMTIDGTQASGCTARLVGKGIFDDYADSKGEIEVQGKVTTITFTLEEKGTYNFSCWMGMARGQIKAV